MDLVVEKGKVHISVVSPVYNIEHTVDELVKCLTDELSKITDRYEIVLVEDYSPDNSWEKIAAHCKRDSHIRGIKLSRNFGQHNAIAAGLEFSSGAWVVVMDCDLQDRPEEISKLYAEAMKGYDIVLARRIERKDGWSKKIASRFFYSCFSYLSGMKFDSTVANFGIYSRKVVRELIRVKEPTSSFSPMVQWVGFKKSYVDVVHGERHEGKSSYSWTKLIDLALSIAISYSDRPLRLIVRLGFLVLATSFVYILAILYLSLMGKLHLRYTGLIFFIWFFSGVFISIMGVTGLYIGKMFERVKDRQIYIIDEVY